MDVDRQKAGLVGVSPADVSRSLVPATSSSRFVAPNYWADPKTGIGYQVQVEVPRPVVRTPQGITPSARSRTWKRFRSSATAAGQLLVRDVATVAPARCPASTTATTCAAR